MDHHIPLLHGCYCLFMPRLRHWILIAVDEGASGFQHTVRLCCCGWLWFGTNRLYPHHSWLLNCHWAIVWSLSKLPDDIGKCDTWCNKKPDAFPTMSDHINNSRLIRAIYLTTIVEIISWSRGQLSNETTQFYMGKIVQYQNGLVIRNWTYSDQMTHWTLDN